MAKLNLSRRNFVGLAAAVGAAASVSTVPVTALAEVADSGKSPTTEVKVVRSCCRACGKKRMRRSHYGREWARCKGGR